MPVILEKGACQKSWCCRRESSWARSSVRAITGGVQGQRPGGGQGGRVPGSSGVLPILNASGELTWAFINTLLICIFMIKKDKIIDRLCGEKYKNGKIGEVYAWIRNMLIVLNIILCWFYLFYHAATNRKLEDKCYVIHFLSFASMLPVIFGIFSPSSHFCQVR